MSSSLDLNHNAPQPPNFALANQKKNAEFHSLFRSVPEDDYLIEDYSAALQRDIIIAGRLYVSEGHVCFSSNILGWVTTLVIAFDEIVAVEKENTAVVFPNAIAVQTLHSRHTFRSLLSRDATYDLITTIWHGADPSHCIFSEGLQWDPNRFRQRQNDSESDSYESDYVYDEDQDGPDESQGVRTAPASVDLGHDNTRHHRQERKREHDGLRRPSVVRSSSVPTDIARASASQKDQGKPISASLSSSNFAPSIPGPAQYPQTQYDDPSGDYDRVVKEDDVPAPLGRVYALLFGTDSARFLMKVLVDKQKNSDVHFDDSSNKGLTDENNSRTYTYMKPLNMHLGPKQTKCYLEEKLDLLDFHRAVVVTVSTHTPDIPSGNTFTVMTKYILTWAPNNSTHIKILCKIDWSGKSWLKSAIERSSFEGQCAYGNDLIAVLNAEITRHHFFPRRRSLSQDGAEDKTHSSKRNRSSPVLDLPPSHNMPSSSSSSSSQTSSDLRWGPLDPLRPYLEPLIHFLGSRLQGYTLIAVLIAVILLVVHMTSVSAPHKQDQPQAVRYEELWQRQEDDLMDWLDRRIGILNDDDEGGFAPHGLIPAKHKHKHKPDPEVYLADDAESDVHDQYRLRSERRSRTWSDNDSDSHGDDVDVDVVDDDDDDRLFVNRFSTQFGSERISDSEMQDLIELTQDRLATLREAVEKRRSRNQSPGGSRPQSTNTQPKTDHDDADDQGAAF